MKISQIDLSAMQRMTADLSFAGFAAAQAGVAMRRGAMPKISKAPPPPPPAPPID